MPGLEHGLESKPAAALYHSGYLRGVIGLFDLPDLVRSRPESVFSRPCKPADPLQLPRRIAGDIILPIVNQHRELLREDVGHPPGDGLHVVSQKRVVDGPIALVVVDVARDPETRLCGRAVEPGDQLGVVVGAHDAVVVLVDGVAVLGVR